MKIMFFAPHAGIWVHAFPEALIAEALKKRGHEIIYVSCQQSFETFCTTMSAYGVNHLSSLSDKLAVCNKCKQYDRLLMKEFNFRNIILNDYLTEADFTQIDSLLATITPENFLDFKLADIEIGRLTLYQILLEYKKNSLNFTPNEWQHFISDLKNSLITFFGLKTILTKEQPDSLVVYNSLYAVNHIAAKLAEQFNAKQYFLHAGGNLATRLETMMLAEKDGFVYYQALLKKWHEFKNIPRSSERIKNVAAHLLSVIKGQTVFSYSTKVDTKALDIRQFFNIQPHQKIVLATMSSGDERFASAMVKAFVQSDKVLFADQFSWLTAVIDYVKSREDLFLIIRVHPREFPNRRDKVISENFHKAQQLFDSLPENVRINWPEDKISLYYLAQEVDLCLNSWSSAGKELAALGIPVLLYSRELQVYPPDINFVGETLDDYFTLFEQALVSGWSFERIRKVFRWYAFEYFETTLNLADSFKVDNYRSFTKRLYSKIARTLNPLYLQQKNCKERATSLSATNIIGQIFEQQKNSLLDFLESSDFAETNLTQETQALISVLNTIFKVLQVEPGKPSTLIKHYQSFLAEHTSSYA